MTTLDKAKKDIIAILQKAGIKASSADIVFPPNPNLGDYSFPLFKVAKEKKIAPFKLAEKLKLKPQGLITEIKIAGPYLNFALDKKAILNDILLSEIKQGEDLKGKKIMMEMVSPNNNKPLHLGHLRNAFLGESVSRLMEFQGAKIIRSCLFNDRGLQFTKSMLAYKLWGKNKTPKKIKGDKFVVEWYVKFTQKAKEDENLELEAKDMVRLWEEGDKKTIDLWKKMTSWANKGIHETLKRINIKFDKIYFEHEIWKKGKVVVSKALKNGTFKLGEGDAVIAEFPKTNLPPKVVQRSDGTAIYTTTDLALGDIKFKEHKLDHSIWCVGQEQDLAFEQLFAIYKQLGYKWHKNCEHLSYKHVFLPEGSMKTREGTVVEADELLDEMYNLASREIKQRDKNLPENKACRRAKIISQSAIRYYLLHIDPSTPIQFDPKQSILFTGNTGPYLLYNYARIASILRKSKKVKKVENYKLKLTDIEWEMIFGIARFSEITSNAAKERDPSHMTKYLYTFTKKFSDFYETSPVLKADEPTRSFRLSLLIKFQNVLKQGLDLLAIDTIEEM